MQLRSLGNIAQIVAVICPNKWNIHSYVYVRYLILIDENDHAIWMDDPTKEDCERIYLHASSYAKTSAYQADCQWCQARDEPSS